MEEWQKTLLKSMTGLKSGELKIATSARQSGKSELIKLYTEHIAKLGRMESEHRQRLIKEGWIPVTCGDHFMKNWSECHVQCKEMFGEDNYTWTGEIFWFRTVEDIFLFKLTFGA